MDITEIIAHQHAEQRRMFGVLEEWPRTDADGLAAVWTRLAILLETHAEAEERYFYPELLRLGTGGADAESVGEEVEDAVKDHNELRGAIRRVARCRAGSAAWWTAVTDANVYNSKHMAEEERQDLADFRQQATLELRHEIGVAFLRYEAVKAASGIPPKDKDPERYVTARRKATKSAVATRAAAKRASTAKRPASKTASTKAAESD